MQIDAPDSRVVTLPAILDYEGLEAVRDSLMEAIDRGPVRVLAGSVERVSTNGLFLLLSAAESAQRAGCRLTVADPSDALRQGIERLALGSFFSPLMEAS